MPNLTAQEIAQHAANAGFTGDDLEIAVAVALAESSGNPSALGDIGLQTQKWGASVGLWQIRSLNPGYGTAAEQATRNHDANLDPATNAQHAYQIYQQRNNTFNDWSTYTEGQYRSHLNAARQGIANMNNGAATDPAPVQQDQQTTPSGTDGQQSNSNGFMSELQKLLEAVGKLLNPADKLKRAANTVGGAAASSAAFGQVQASGTAHQAHTANTQAYRDHATRGQERLRTQSDEIRSGAKCYEDLSGQQADSINKTAQKVRAD